jgi:hypothetical protein
MLRGVKRADLQWAYDSFRAHVRGATLTARFRLSSAGALPAA